eukprot:scaffold9968_cov113-Skeletonema_dohrnii-CCMP3373.AAC.2
MSKSSSQLKPRRLKRRCYNSRAHKSKDPPAQQLIITVVSPAVLCSKPTMIMKTTLLCSLISMLVIASSAFVLQHNALQHRGNKIQLNLKRTVSKQISFSKKAVTPNHDTNSNEESYDENAFHRRIVHFEHHRKDEDEDNDVKKSKKPYGGWNHRQFAKAIDP